MGEVGRQVRDSLLAVCTVNRLSATVGYNLGYFLLGVGLGVLVGGGPLGRVPVGLAGVYFLATLLAKLQASVVDAIHDRRVDATNPEKSSIAGSVELLGVERTWSLAATEATLGLIAFGLVARHVGAWPLLVGGAFTLLGFWYSYPPRLKERGVLNHVVTTTVDVAFVVLPVAYLVGETVSPAFLVVGAVVYLFTFGYHVVHQAADTYYDEQSGVTTFTTRIGVPRSLALAATLTAASAGLAVALGYPLAVLGSVAVTGLYVNLYWKTHDIDPQTQTDTVADRFDIAWVAAALNAATALAVWRHVFERPGIEILATLL